MRFLKGEGHCKVSQHFTFQIDLGFFLSMYYCVAANVTCFVRSFALSPSLSLAPTLAIAGIYLLPLTRSTCLFRTRKWVCVSVQDCT